MRDYLNNLPQEIQELIRLSGNIAANNSMRASLVGGFVRDLILGVKNLDLDIVVEGNGIKFAEDLSFMLKAKLVRHHRFGTATVVIHRGLKIDIASARKETYPHAGSLPVVTPGTIEDDLVRRDFSINAMAISIMEKDFGRLIDYFMGKVDLRQRKIRVLHDLSFIDDPTRMLRAIRFEQRYGFRIETETLRYFKKAAKLRVLKQVQPQRTRDELILVLKEEHPIKEIRRIKTLIGVDFVDENLHLSNKTYELLKSAEKEIGWFNKLYHQHRSIDAWLIYFMALLDSLNINDIKRVCNKFVFRRGEEKRILDYKNINRNIILELSHKEVRASWVFHLLEPLSYETIIMIKAKHKNANLHKHIEDFLEIYNGIRILITGDDLHKLGIAPGPYYQRIFTIVLKAKLDGKVHTKQEELGLIREIIKK